MGSLRRASTRARGSAVTRSWFTGPVLACATSSLQASFHAWEQWAPIDAAAWRGLVAAVVDWLLMASSRATLAVHGVDPAATCGRYPSSFSRTAAVAANRSVCLRRVFCTRARLLGGYFRVVKRAQSVCATPSLQVFDEFCTSAPLLAPSQMVVGGAAAGSAAAGGAAGGGALGATCTWKSAVYW